MFNKEVAGTPTNQTSVGVLLCLTPIVNSNGFTGQAKTNCSWEVVREVQLSYTLFYTSYLCSERLGAKSYYDPHFRRWGGAYPPPPAPCSDITAFYQTTTVKLSMQFNPANTIRISKCPKLSSSKLPDLQHLRLGVHVWKI